tara:strand:- start:199 stop:567 length:369 start_codon:yes stop_codon:yes gene_type:complete
MFQRKPRRFRHRTNGRSNMIGNDGGQSRLGSNSFQNGQTRNNFRQSLSPEKLFEKYTSLAKEAMSSGDKTLSENYLQHADHFMRIIEDRNRIRNQSQSQSKVEVADNSNENQKKLSDINKKD